MASYTRYTSSTKAAAATDCCAPACPACGLIECLCRPRFFAGQLLSEVDLNRLEDYIIKKNRLHNRYLNDWGAVCGLEVLCDPCGEGVTVRPGYAISPCGDDIIVCNGEVVPICDLIKRCRKRDPNDCLNPSYNSAAFNRDDCLNGAEDWILSICYDEKASRGITPLQQSSGCKSCSCGGSGACGCKSKSSCGCGGSGGGSHKCTCGSGASKTSTANPKPPQCEPTVICETYRFAVSKPPARTREQELEDRLGALVQRIQCCYYCIEQLQQQAPANGQNIQQWCCEIREALIDYLAQNPGTDCSIIERVRALCSGDPSFDKLANEVGEIVADLKKQCRCLAFLPPCPPAAGDNCVPLATVTVRKRDCRILKICNFTGRKFAITIPNLLYWLSPLAIGYTIRTVLERLCCTATQYDNLNVGIGHVDPGIPVDRPVNIGGYLAYAARAKSFDMKKASLAQMGIVDEKGLPLLNTEQLSNLAQSMLASDVLRPLLSQTLGADTLGTTTRLGSEVSELRTMLKEQQSMIAELRRKLGEK
jgi:hypothetical protein